jgi:predicted  nucleic acid-binding Zn-ribbon protein
VNESLLHLYELQKVDSMIDELIENRGALPSQVESMRSLVTDQRSSLASAEEHVRELEARTRNLNAESTDLREKVEKFKSQQFDVKTTREYDAITFQLEDGQQRLTKNLEEMTRLGLELEQARAEVTHFKESLGLSDTELEVSEKELKGVMAETAEEEKRLREKRAALEKQVSAQHLSMYNRVRPAKSGVGVVPVRNGVCGGCFNAIPRQLVLELKRGDRHALCEYCGRIVVGEPISLAVDGEPQPVSQVDRGEESEETES